METNRKRLKNIIFVDITYIWVIKGHLYTIFSLLLYLSYRKIYERKIVPLMETNTKRLKNINFVDITYIWVIKGHLYIIFSLLLYISYRKTSKEKVATLVKNNAKLLYKTSILFTKRIYESSKVNCTSIFSF